MRRLLICASLSFACDGSPSQPPEPAEVEPAVVAAPEVAPEPEPVEPEGSPTLEAPDDAAPEEDAPTEPFSVVDIDPTAGPLEHQLRMHARRGAEGGQRVVLEMGAPWCPPCKRAKALLAEEAVKAELGGVVVLRANSDVWGEDLDALGFDAPVIPVYYLLDGEGAPSGTSVRGDRWKNRQQVRQGLLAFLRG